MLHRLEAADGNAELLALDHVRDGQVEHRLAEADEHRRGAERAAVERQLDDGWLGGDDASGGAGLDAGGAPGSDRPCRRE